MYAKALNDATITIPSADLRSIVLSAVGVAQDNTTTDLPNSNSASMGISVGGFSLVQWGLIGAIGYFLLKGK